MIQVAGIVRSPIPGTVGATVTKIVMSRIITTNVDATSRGKGCMWRLALRPARGR
jgi:hypothetical protein